MNPAQALGEAEEAQRAVEGALDLGEHGQELRAQNVGRLAAGAFDAVVGQDLGALGRRGSAPRQRGSPRGTRSSPGSSHCSPPAPSARSPARASSPACRPPRRGRFPRGAAGDQPAERVLKREPKLQLGPFALGVEGEGEGRARREVQGRARSGGRRVGQHADPLAVEEGVAQVDPIGAGVHIQRVQVPRLDLQRLAQPVGGEELEARALAETSARGRVDDQPRARRGIEDELGLAGLRLGVGAQED